MKIIPNTFNTVNFNARSYKLWKRGTLVQTDNNPNMGNKPNCVYSYYDDRNKSHQTNTVPMERRGELYSVSIRRSIPEFSYHILYTDTGKIDDNNGKDYFVNSGKIHSQFDSIFRKKYNQPLVHAIKPGTAVGELFIKSEIDEEDIKRITQPTIILTKKFFAKNDNPNVIGLIFTESDIGSLEHLGASYRQRTKICATLFDTEKIKQLKNLSGKNVEIKLRSDSLEAAETDKKPEPMVFEHIDIPFINYSNEILTSDRYTPDLVGAKAVNLAKLENMSKQGKIDAKIPASIVLPYGYIENLIKQNPQNTIAETIDDFLNSDTILYNPKYNEVQMNSLISFLKSNSISENAINSDRIMVRSAFNGEDLSNYSAAGLYESFSASLNNKNLFNRIIAVADSKWSPNAVMSRKIYGIPDSSVKPCVIIQNKVNPDYKFTLYTDDNEGNVKIELYSNGEYEYYCPHVFTYNKETKKLNYDSIQMPKIGYLNFDENFDLIENKPLEDDLSNNEDLFKQLKKLVDNALVIEREFGHPQDIEGGILGDDIYLWQTRNIVNNN